MSVRRPSSSSWVRSSSRDYEPGLHIKAPWPINNVRKFDKRILTLDTRPERFLTGEKKNVSVDFFVKWRIRDAAKYYTSFMGDERQAGLRLLQIVNNGLQLEFDQRTIKQVVSDDRSVMMTDLTTKANSEVQQFGIEIVDVRIKQIELPEEVSSSVYARMRAERERIAKEFRAQGQEAAKGIQAIADRERTVILAEARVMRRSCAVRVMRVPPRFTPMPTARTRNSTSSTAA